MSEAVVKFMVVRNGVHVVNNVGNNGRFDTYEAAEITCRELASKLEGVMDDNPYYEIKKIFTV